MRTRGQTFGFVALLFGVLATPINHADASGTNRVASTNLVGTTAPVVVLRDIEGEYVNLGALYYFGDEVAQKPRSAVVLNFFSVDCAPCKRELPLFLKVCRENKGKPIRFYLVCTDPFSKQETLKKMLKDFGVDCGVLLDPYRVACGKFGVDGIPRTFVIAPDGQFQADITGAHDGYEESLRKTVEKTLRPNQ